MLEFFASLYEWFGLIPFYAKDLGDHLRGFDVTCTGYIGSTEYMYVGWAMILLTIFAYFLQYHIINSPIFNKKHHWWIIAFALFMLNFLIAFALPFNDLQTGDFCKDLNLSIWDCIGFAFSNALWSLIFFILLTSFPLPRKFAGHNMSETTFWKP